MKFLFKFILTIIASISTYQVFSNVTFVIDSENPTVVRGLGDLDLNVVLNQLNTNADLFDVIINPVTGDAYQPQDSYTIDQIQVEAHRGPGFISPIGDNISYNNAPIDLDLFESLQSLAPSQKIYFFVKKADSGLSLDDGFVTDWNNRVYAGLPGLLVV